MDVAFARLVLTCMHRFLVLAALAIAASSVAGTVSVPFPVVTRDPLVPVAGRIISIAGDGGEMSLAIWSTGDYTLFRATRITETGTVGDPIDVAKALPTDEGWLSIGSGTSSTHLQAIRRDGTIGQVQTLPFEAITAASAGPNVLFLGRSTASIVDSKGSVVAGSIAI